MARALIALAAAMAQGVLGVLPASAQDAEASPIFGTVSLAAGFEPDPHAILITTEGASIDAPCGGLVRAPADIHLDYAGADAPLVIAVAGVGTSLLVNSPDGAWYCDDDGGAEGANPSVAFERAQSGRYAVWIGSAEEISAELSLSSSVAQ